MLIPVLTSRASGVEKFEREEKTKDLVAQPWISMRSGVKTMAFASIGMVFLTAWHLDRSEGWPEVILGDSYLAS
jgi:hypothetical protein